MPNIIDLKNALKAKPQPIPLIASICESIGLDERDSSGQTPLHLVASYGNVDGIVILLSRDADIKARDYAKETPLYKASESTSAGAVEILIRAGSELEASNTKSKTPLHKAAQRGRSEAIKLLIDAGSDLAAKDRYGLIPLHYACENSHAESVRVLVDAGSPLEAITYSGNTALHLAALKCKHEVIKILLAVGANLAATNYDDKTPMELIELCSSAKKADQERTMVIIKEALNEKYMELGVVLADIITGNALHPSFAADARKRMISGCEDEVELAQEELKNNAFLSFIYKICYSGGRNINPPELSYEEIVNGILSCDIKFAKEDKGEELSIWNAIDELEKISSLELRLVVMRNILESIEQATFKLPVPRIIKLLITCLTAQIEEAYDDISFISSLNPYEFAALVGSTDESPIISGSD